MCVGGGGGGGGGGGWGELCVWAEGVFASVCCVLYVSRQKKRRVGRNVWAVCKKRGEK